VCAGNRSLAQLMKLRLHTSTCSPLIKRHNFSVNHGFVWHHLQGFGDGRILRFEVIVVA
jgi:hypothetical protein